MNHGMTIIDLEAKVERAFARYEQVMKPSGLPVQDGSNDEFDGVVEWWTVREIGEA
jgi:hypothetical protein